MFLGYFVLLNMNFVIPAYTLLLMYSAVVVIPSLGNPPRLDLRDSVILVSTALLVHLPLYAFSPRGLSPIYTYVFSAVTAIIEELFFRGYLLKRIGLPLQALVFMYSHLSVSDPVFLVNTALLAPHYFLLGLIAGLIAGEKGFEGSSMFHVAYNIIGLCYIPQFNVQNVFILVISDVIAMIFFVWYFWCFNN